jgi:hypothetical protein
VLQRHGVVIDARGGPFRGIGSLEKIATEKLANAWETGDASAVSLAMTEFRDTYQEALLEKAPYSRTDQSNYRPWTRRFAQWLYSTSHISIEYGIKYDGIDIQKLSPGTRGIVLILLYLALDDADDRPLIIDQPEENLDPKLIYDELVPLFQAAKYKRQVIIVTHNANLVVGTACALKIVLSIGRSPCLINGHFLTSLDFDNISSHNDFADQNQAIMSYNISTLLTRNLHEVFGENDPARRRAAIDEIFTEDCVFYDPLGGLYRGHDEIHRVAGAIKATHPDFRYQPIAEPEELGNGGRIQWVSGRPGEAPAYAGTDFIIARDGRIAALYLFFDKLP